MTVLLSRPYQGMASGAIVTLDDATESALIAQGLAATSAAALTAGAQTVNMTKGRALVAAAAASVVITCDKCAVASSVFAVISQSGADATATSIVRCTPAAGSFTITANAAATAATQVDWVVLNNSGAAGVIR